MTLCCPPSQGCHTERSAGSASSSSGAPGAVFAPGVLGFPRSWLSGRPGPPPFGVREPCSRFSPAATYPTLSSRQESQRSWLARSSPFAPRVLHRGGGILALNAPFHHSIETSPLALPCHPEGRAFRGPKDLNHCVLPPNSPCPRPRLPIADRRSLIALLLNYQLLTTDYRLSP